MKCPYCGDEESKVIDPARPKTVSGSAAAVSA